MSDSKKVTSNLLHYLHQQIPNFHMDPLKHEALCFRERLGIHYKNGRFKKLVGNYFISVERVGPKAQEFLVNIYSSVIIDGYLGEQKILSTVTGDLQFLEEKRNEHFENSNGAYTRNLYLGTEESYYTVKIVQESSSGMNLNSFDLAYENNYSLLSEGSNILFIKYLALNNFIGHLNLHFITIEGQIINCNYECLGIKHLRVNNSRIMDVYRIKQTIINRNMYNENMIYLTKTGRILKIDWSDTPYEVKTYTLLDPSIHNQDPINIPLPESWKVDTELISKYIHKKVEEKSKQHNYLLQHSEIENLVVDYVNSLLSGKPEDVLVFTSEYFKTVNLNEILTEKESSAMISKKSIDTPDEKDFTLQKSIGSIQTNCSCGDSSNNKISSSENIICNHFIQGQFLSDGNYFL